MVHMPVRSADRHHGSVPAGGHWTRDLAAGVVVRGVPVLRRADLAPLVLDGVLLGHGTGGALAFERRQLRPGGHAHDLVGG